MRSLGGNLLLTCTVPRLNNAIPGHGDTGDEDLSLCLV